MIKTEKVGIRIKRLREAVGLTQRDFCEFVDVSLGVIGNAESGRNNPNAAALEQIVIKYPNLNARWLLTGEGPMWEGEAPPSLEASPQPEVGHDIDRLVLLASKGASLAIWRVWRLIADRGPMTQAELHAALPGQEGGELLADLTLGEEYGLLTRKGRGQGAIYEAGTGVLRSQDLAELSQLGLEAVHQLTGTILPKLKAEPELARLATVSLTLPAGTAPKTMREFWESWRRQAIAATEPEGDEDHITMVLGIAVTDTQKDAKLKS